MDRGHEQWRAWLDCVVAMLRAPFPYVEPQWLEDDTPLQQPHDVHPAFGNCFDWHSSVHMHWSALRLLALAPDLPGAAAAEAVLTEHLTTDNLDAEATFLARSPLYERPYGRAWALQLVADLERQGPSFLDDLDTHRLRTELVASLDHWCRTLVRPERAGTHRNTAFNLLIARDAAERLGQAQLVERFDATARRCFAGDHAAPVHLEPSGEDFLSPSLAEAHLLAVLPGFDGFGDWVEAWLPVDLGPLARPIEVPDTDDPRIVHLHGLNLSRAFHLDALVADPRVPGPVGDALRTARSAYGDDVLAQAVRGDVGSAHWLVTYALLATQGLDGRPRRERILHEH